MSETAGDPTVGEDVDEVEPTRSVSDLRRSAAAQDVLLFCVAFSGGAVLYLVGHLLLAADPLGWEAGLSDDLLLSGLVAGELFVLWNNGLRQGVRGHSVGKHRSGLRVVAVGSGRPVGVVRGLARGLVVVGLFDLALAAVPVGLPTVLRRLTPEEWHVGGAAYVAVVLVVVSLLPFARTVPDLLLRTRVVRSHDRTSPRRRRALAVLDVVGVVGVLAVCLAYVAFFWPLIWQLPSLR
ncbi:hypothetical protein GCM10009821_00550 [Aeromicrobium halocynthiae]|uniref:RDD domain-containing protein n=1 Tax=Aeromicrobium halocynthiae TaxID=560557 RepID=A0ABN2VPP9_9ACTN